MTIRYKCDKCGSVLKIKDELAGADGKCPKCKKQFVIPQPEAEPTDESGAVAAATSETQVAPVAAGKAARKDDDDFDPVAFLMDDDAPNAKASAGLTSPPPAEARPATDRQGRRHIVAPPPSPAAGGSPAADAAHAAMSMSASANARELLTKTMEDSRLKAGSMPESPQRRGIDFQAMTYFLTRGGGGLLGVCVAVVLMYYLVSWVFSNKVPLPKLAPVTGTVTLGGQPFPNVLVYLTPLNKDGLSTKGNKIRLRDANGITDDNGYFTVQYMDGVPGAPVGKVKIWLRAVYPADISKIPQEYRQAGDDIREVREAGNAGSFNLQIK